MVSPNSIWMGLSMHPIFKGYPHFSPPHFCLKCLGRLGTNGSWPWSGGTGSIDMAGGGDPIRAQQWPTVTRKKNSDIQIFRWCLQAWSWWILMEVDGYWWKLRKKNCQSSDAKKFPFPPDISLPYSAFEIIRSNTKISQDAQGQWIKIYHYWITTNSDTSTCFRLMKSYEEV